MISSPYLERHLDTAGLKLAVQRTIKFLEKKTREFDAIAFRGMSGALVAPSVATALGKNLLMVRKEHSHSTMNVEGFYGTPQRYIIVDDFISMGSTCKEIITQVSNFCDENTCVGIALYNNSGRSRSELQVNGDSFQCWPTDEVEL
jgi:adenine/guanine phosphoribosyltransferase-like PRPP-binding protein